MEAIDSGDIITALTAALVGVLVWQAQRIIARIDRIEDAVNKAAANDVAHSSDLEDIERRIGVLERRKR